MPLHQSLSDAEDRLDEYASALCQLSQAVVPGIAGKERAHAEHHHWSKGSGQVVMMETFAAFSVNRHFISCMGKDEAWIVPQTLQDEVQ